MPEDRPIYLGAYLSRIIRCLSVDRFRAAHREKRGGIHAVTEELLECIPDSATPESDLENGRLRKVLNDFLSELGEEQRRIFVRRYFYSDDIAQISSRLGIGTSKVKTTLFRLRLRLKERLEQEGIPL